MMKNNTNLKNLVLNDILSTTEMMLVKGGVNANAFTNGLANAKSVVTVNGTTADDKRRERPGGGISTL
jgi:hypothetical protein